jgi:small ligand-binding sensory domain FIST
MPPTAPPPFRAAHAGGASWHEAVAACLARLGPLPLSGGLGILYVADSFADALDLILAQLREATGVVAWVGTAAVAVLGGGQEPSDQCAVTVLVADLADGRYALFDGLADGTADLDERLGAWARRQGGVTGLVHADPRQAGTAQALARFAAATGAFLIGGVGSAATGAPQIARGPTEGGLSGALLSPEVHLLSGLSQGCSPIGPVHTVTRAFRNLVHSIDERPALAVLKEEMGELLARQLDRVGGYIHIALPVEDSDRPDDYQVRDLVAIDAGRGILAVADEVAVGRKLRFVRRDAPSAINDLDRMLQDLHGRVAGRPIRGGLYHSCVARGPRLFGPGGLELRRIREVLGPIPLAGFYGGGEIFGHRLYTYTGVLSLFL